MRTKFIIMDSVREIRPSDSKVYVYKKWNHDWKPVQPQGNYVFENIDDYIIYDSDLNSDLVVRDNDGELIVAKLSRRKAQCMCGSKSWRQVRNLMNDILKTKPNVKRGKKMVVATLITNVLGSGKIL